MKRERLSEDDQFAVFWGEIQDELVVHIKMLIEQLDKQEENEFDKKWEEKSIKKKEILMAFSADWMMPKNAPIKYKLNARGLIVYFNPVMYQEFNQIATKFVQDAVNTAIKEAVYNKDWVCNGWLQTVPSNMSYNPGCICMKTKEKFRTK